MKKSSFFAVLAVIFLFFEAFAYEKNSFCEPSLVFPEIFPIEAASTFSYTMAENLYENSDALFFYLNSVDFSENQFQVRYLYYLRTKQFFPALSLLMTMVNLNAYPGSFVRPYDEFFNLLQMAAAAINENSDENGFSLENPEISKEQEKRMRSVIFGNNNDKPLDSQGLSDILTAEIVLNFATINMRNKMHGKETVISQKIVFFILASSFKMIFSALDQGVDLDDDPFFKELFNTFVAMQKDEKQIFSSFLYAFLEKIYTGETTIGLYRYILLRQFGMIENAADGWLNIHGIKTAVSWIEETEKRENLKTFSSFFEKDEKSCGYLSEKLKWIVGMPSLPGDAKQRIGHGIKIAEIIEQCGDLDYIGLVRKDAGEEDEQENEPYPKWAYYLSNALQTISESDFDDEQAVQILKKGLLAAIFEIPRDESRGSEDIFELMMFLYRHKKRDEVLKAMFLRQIMHGDFDKNIELYRQSIEIIDEFLYN